MINNRKDILLKGYFVALLLLIVSLGVVYKLFNLQLDPEERKRFEEFAQNTNFKEAVIPAERGNLYASDGSLLATSVWHYSVGIDGVSMRQSLIDEHLDALADSLSDMFGKPKNYYTRLILNAKKKQKYYVPIAFKLTFQELSRLKQFPIFNKGQIKGGLAVDKELVRVRSIKDIGARTLGYVTEDRKVGLEGAYDSLLSGKDGKRLEQRMGGGNWKPINISTEIDPQEGLDVCTTIDVSLQNIAHQALYDQLVKFNAHHGSVVVMEVATGEVKAISNLSRLDDGNYADIQNFAVGEANEPGSTVKTVSLLAAIKDEVIDSATQVNTGNGSKRLFGRRITDSHGYGTINAKKVLEKSSNIGTAMLITEAYQDDPDDFLDILRDDWLMDQPLGVEIPGEATPYIPDPDDKTWSKQSLSSISYGYETKFTPLQILTFYNGIANGGKMLKPLFVKEIRRRGEVVEKFDPVVRVERMASPEAIGQIQEMLKGVVKQGTATDLYNPDFVAAGKTGTTRAEYWIKDQPWQYRSSFVGYFPADNPKYSCIVVIHKPDRSKSYYGATVAGPVFKTIMEKVFVSSPREIKIEPKDSTQSSYTYKAFELDEKKKFVPNLVGKSAHEVVPALENLGLIVKYTGAGKVTKQSLPPGTALKPQQTIYLETESL